MLKIGEIFTHGRCNRCKQPTLLLFTLKEPWSSESTLDWKKRLPWEKKLRCDLTPYLGRLIQAWVTVEQHELVLKVFGVFTSGVGYVVDDEPIRKAYEALAISMIHAIQYQDYAPYQIIVELNCFMEILRKKQILKNKFAFFLGQTRTPTRCPQLGNFYFVPLDKSI